MNAETEIKQATQHSPEPWIGHHSPCVNFCAGIPPTLLAIPLRLTLAAKDSDNGRLRKVISEIVKNLKSGAVAETCSLEFMECVPNEVKLVISAKDAEIERLKNKFTEIQSDSDILEGKTAILSESCDRKDAVIARLTKEREQISAMNVLAYFEKGKA